MSAEYKKAEIEGTSGRAYAAIICRGANDMGYVGKLADPSIFVEKIKWFLMSVGCQRLLVLGPLGMRRLGGIAETSRSIETAVREMGRSLTADYCDVSKIPDTYYQKGKFRPSPEGQEALSRVVGPRLRRLLAREEGAADPLPPGVVNAGYLCYQISVCQALIHVPAFRGFIPPRSFGEAKAGRLSEFGRALSDAYSDSDAYVSNDAEIHTDAGMGAGKKAAFDFLNRVIQKPGFQEGGLWSLFSGNYRQRTSCGAFNRITDSDHDTHCLHAPLIYDFPPDYLDVDKCLRLAYADKEKIRKRCYGAHAEGDMRERNRAITKDWLIPPDVLAAQILRFREDAAKIAPEGIDMKSPECLTFRGIDYQLRSVAEHIE